MAKVVKNRAFLLFIFTVVAVFGLSFASHRTQQSSFCGYCHFMSPYIKQWRTSSHRTVECVKCHDYSAMKVIAFSLRYATGAYNPRPRAEVKDKNCLQKGCHATRLLPGKVTFKDGIQFDHQLHLTKTKRGMNISCTSCHNQIVQGEHIAVTEKVCFLCHFKGASKGESVTGCPSCHGMPTRTVEHDGFSFNHESYLKIGVECKQCHVEVTSGDGGVPEDRCFSCHVERTERIKDVAFIHETHISKRKVDCLMCHTPIEHGNIAMVGPLQVKCETCHVKLHNTQKEMYMGIGGEGVADLPSRMFAAQVSCSGCHTHVTDSGEVLFGEKRIEAQRGACVSCHGKGYDLMLDDWKKVMKQAQSECKGWLNEARSAVRSSGVSDARRTRAAGFLELAEHNFDFVQSGRGEHNVEYAMKLLRESVMFGESAVKEIGGAAGDRTYSGGPLLKTADGYCLALCHKRIHSPEKVSYKGKSLPHKFHIEDAGLGCGACHSTEKHKALDVKEKLCKDCHQ